MSLRETYDWIINDMSYKAPEQMSQMTVQRWMPMIMEAVEAELKEPDDEVEIKD
jgi:hypothetical protein